MLLLIATRSHIPLPHQNPFLLLQSGLVPSLILECKTNKRGDIFKSDGVFTRCLGLKKLERNLGDSWACWSDLSDGDVELELQMIDFRSKSKKPRMFPTKEGLIRGGRMDLGDAMTTVGGWYSFGWDKENVIDSVEEAMDLDSDDSLRNQMKVGFSSKENLNFPHLTTPAALKKPLETSVNSGIEDILSRIGKRRNQDFRVNLENNACKAHCKRKDDGKDRRFDASLGVARFELGGKRKLTADFQHKGAFNISDGKCGHDIEPESWRTWSSKRAGFQYKDFKAAEINFSKNHEETERGNYHDEDKGKALHYSKMKSHLHNIEYELTSALHSLRSIKEEWTSQEKLSDAWEFQENEIMRAKRRLRVIKAKLDIAEGKMTLAILYDAKQKVRVKQQVHGANKALQLLRTIHIMWPNPAFEVFLAGSFDGWAIQRKMKRSRMGIFSVCLMLYPGRYEIKFIVDGMWKVDPLRPIISISGYENNLLIVT